MPVRSEVSTPCADEAFGLEGSWRRRIEGIATGMEAMNIMAKNGSHPTMPCQPAPARKVSDEEVSTESSRQR